MIANLSKQIGNHTNAQLDEGILRHMVLNSLRAIRVKFKEHSGDVIIACDSRKNWRKEVFPYYKARRAEKRAESELDWNMIFESFAAFKQELRDYFPYRVIEVEFAEADDVIGTLVQHFGTEEFMMGFDREEIIIVSGDKDFQQLQKFENVQQWDHVNKRMFTCKNAAKFLKEMILTGDTSDGVPNFLSDDDVLAVKGKRQKPMQSKKMDSYLANYPDNPESETLLRNWKRNQQMIDLSFTPENIRAQVMEQYEAQAGKTRAKLVNYFISKKLKNLHAFINDF